MFADFVSLTERAIRMEMLFGLFVITTIVKWRNRCAGVIAIWREIRSVLHADRMEAKKENC
jgi:hypothetical protein